MSIRGTTVTWVLLAACAAALVGEGVSWKIGNATGVWVCLLTGAAIALVYGFFVEPRNRFRKGRFEYIGMAVVFVFLTFLFYASKSK